jgi:hypothetical protein
MVHRCERFARQATLPRRIDCRRTASIVILGETARRDFSPGTPAMTDSDESPTIDDPDERAWVARQRRIVIDYLTSQRCEHNGVSLEPRWFVSPYVAVWAVRSKVNPDRVGWWAISGDLPTDYMTAAGQRTTGDVLVAFAMQWHAAAERMKDGEHLDDYVVGDPSRPKELAPLLEARAKLLQKFGDDLNRSEAAGEGEG